MEKRPLEWCDLFHDVRILILTPLTERIMALTCRRERDLYNSTKNTTNKETNILDLALTEGCLEVVRWQILAWDGWKWEREGRPNYEFAFQYGHLNVVEWLILKKYVKNEDFIDLARYETPLMYLAAYSGNITLVQYLLSAIILPSFERVRGFVVFGAMFGGHFHILDWLVNCEFFNFQIMRSCMLDKNYETDVPLLKWAAKVQGFPYQHAQMRKLLTSEARFTDAARAWIEQNCPESGSTNRTPADALQFIPVGVFAGPVNNNLNVVPGGVFSIQLDPFHL